MSVVDKADNEKRDFPPLLNTSDQSN